MVIQGSFITSFQFLVSMILGFYILDIILLISNKFKKKKIENDMLRAIMIMNSAFKSGKSTIQAVEIASEKLRMYNVLSRKMQQVVCLKWNF